MWMWEWIQAGRGSLRSGATSIALAQLAGGSTLHGQLEALRGRSVLLATDEPLSAALALIELDGVARRLVLCPPDLQGAHLPAVIAAAQVEVLLSEAAPRSPLALQARALLPQPLAVTTQPAPLARARARSQDTEWILLTSGTSGPPKLVLHTLASLTHAFARETAAAEERVWSTFYDIRRYGGLQILLRALRGATLLLSGAAPGAAAHLAAAAAAGVTHLTGTASHWRAVLMSGLAERIAPRYVRLSGEIADQGILDALQATYPRACVAHAFASTEAGVAFEVEDGRAGFPADWLERAAGASQRGPGSGGGPWAQLRIVEDTLRVRSGGTAACYLGSPAASLRDEQGFVDTADRVELRAGRYHFLGRGGGIINVGGLKVHPEEVEAVINAQPWVRLSRVRARRNPITGAVVCAEVVLIDAPAHAPRPSEAQICAQIAGACRAALPPHKVPASIQVVPSLAVSAAGKLVRPGA